MKVACFVDCEQLKLHHKLLDSCYCVEGHVMLYVDRWVWHVLCLFVYMWVCYLCIVPVLVIIWVFVCVDVDWCIVLGPSVACVVYACNVSVL